MDFSRFRTSGDLSDIIVLINGQESKLHRFPLYARSDYFCQLTRSNPLGESEVSRIELDDFPGGMEVFDQVADFCYNMPVNITKDNAVAVRCATEYLKMNGSGNFMEVAQNFISDSISTSKSTGTTAGPVAMLMDCNEFGDIADSAGIVGLCIDALIECWTRPSTKPASIGAGSVFSKVPYRSKYSDTSVANSKYGDTTSATSKYSDIGANSAFTKVQTTQCEANDPTGKLDEVSINCLISIRPDWFATFLTTANTRGVPLSELGHLAVRYVSAAIDTDTLNSNSSSNASNGSSSINNNSSKLTSTSTPNEDNEDSLKPDGSEKETDEAEVADAFELSSQRPKETTAAGQQIMDIGVVLDQVILVLPEKAYNIPTVTMEWLTKVLRIATTRGCKCRAHLVRVAGEMLTRLGPEELCVISPSVLHDIVVDSSEDRSDQSVDTKPSIHSERACTLVDTYLSQMSAKGVLTSETFRLLVSATKGYPRTSHDHLYTILESVMKTEKDKLSPGQRTELIELVNFDLLSEANLQRALDEDMSPSGQIASSAIKLCSRLRSELASVKYIAEMQEEDIQKYQTVAAAASVASSLQSTSPSLSSERRHHHFIPLTARERNIDSGFADVLEPTPKSLSDQEALTDEDKPDPLRAAQSVLTAARHKLSVPVYTGYRPALLTRLSSPSNASAASHSHQMSRTAVEHDISLEEELEFKFDRSFRSLDPRVRHQRINIRDPPHHVTHSHHTSTQRSYFPYSGNSYRY